MSISTKTTTRRLREKYCHGICGQNYIETGSPQLHNERMELLRTEIKDDMKRILKESRKAEKAALRAYKKNCKDKGEKPVPADHIVFC